MNNKYFNDAIIGNGNMLVSFTKKGELLRLFYPSVDYKQQIDFWHTGVSINDSHTIWLHDDMNNKYEQKFEKNTNILNTNIYNSYFNIDIEQKDYVIFDKSVLVKKYKFRNLSKCEQKIDFIIYSKIKSDEANYVSGYFKDNILMQYSHDYTLAMYSNQNTDSHQVNGASQTIGSGNIYGKDYIGMSEDSSLKYSIGYIKPKEEKEIVIYISLFENSETKNEIIDKIRKVKKLPENKEYLFTKEYWNNYVKKHKTTYIQEGPIDEIYTRSILTFPLLTNPKTGGISAGVEIDENMTKCGRYSYCWPRDSAFITVALDMCNMEELVDKYFTEFAKKTQLNNGMWEQRYYTDGRLAPCWGYQIDETASIVYGTWMHYKKTQEMKFLINTIPMSEKAVEFLIKYTDNIVENKYVTDVEKKDDLLLYPSYDLWEEREGVHTYSLGTIYAAFKAMINMYNIVIDANRNEKIKNLQSYCIKIKQYIEENFYTGEYFKRNSIDDYADISLLGLAVPFDVFDVNDEMISKTALRLEHYLSDHKGGLKRYENDNYVGGNPWTIANLWMALYYAKKGNILKSKEYFNWVVDTMCKHGYLAEQINTQSQEPSWVIGLGWAHAMYIIVLEELYGKN